MSKHLAVELGSVIRTALLGVPTPQGSGRPATKAIFAVLKKSVRPLVARHFGGPVLCRYSGCPEGPAQSYSHTPEKVFKVLEYLWDFSLSRYAIPQALGDPNATPIANGKYELLLVAESELGTANEICRDLLKLLEARASVRCLLYKQPKRATERAQLETRMVQVMHRHAQFLPNSGTWLFVGLTWAPPKLACDVRTLNADNDALVDV